MRIKLLRPVQFRIVGTILEVPDGVGELWILQGKAALSDPPPERSLVPQTERAERMIPRSRKTQKMTV